MPRYVTCRLGEPTTINVPRETQQRGDRECMPVAMKLLESKVKHLHKLSDLVQSPNNAE